VQHIRHCRLRSIGRRLSFAAVDVLRCAIASRIDMQKLHSRSAVLNPGSGYSAASSAPSSAAVIRWEKVLVPMLLLALGAAALSLDLPVACWCLDQNCPEALHKWLSLCEVFGHGLGVCGILMAVAVLDPAARRTLPRLLIASLGVGLVANLGKLLVARTRPHGFSFEGGVADTFGQWLPLADLGSSLQGCPSSHMATAAGLAMSLAWLYPRGRWLFVLLAISAGGQRIVAGDHFLSDVVWGAAVGVFCATGFFDGGLFARFFDRLERRRRGDAVDPQMAQIFADSIRRQAGDPRVGHRLTQIYTDRH
jgi:membrane-associated phospholipid phosphatase